MTLVSSTALRSPADGRSVHADSFQPNIGFKTRYGLVANPFHRGAGASSGALTTNSNKYYRRVRIETLCDEVGLQSGPAEPPRPSLTGVFLCLNTTEASLSLWRISLPITLCHLR